jgi:ATP-dependent DNA ligase
LGAGKRKGLFGSYEIAIRDDDGLIPFGSVGSGFTDDDLIMITAAYKELGANRIIIEVKGDMITKNENGDYGLRFPRYVKYRDDKDEPTHMKELKI